MYADLLKDLFNGIALTVEDLFFLESFQIEYLPDRAPKQELGVLLSSYPVVLRYLVAMCPKVSKFIDDLLKETVAVQDNAGVDEICNDVLWEIADLIIYNKYPEVYDDRFDFDWDIEEIIPSESLEGKVAVDAGAGPGRLAFLAAQFADTVYAVEPAQGFRKYIKDNASRENVRNLFVADGFLDSLPLPDNTADVLMTSNAIGWNLVAELEEIERVLKPNGQAIHLFRSAEGDVGKQLNDVLISPEWKYTRTSYAVAEGGKVSFRKVLSLWPCSKTDTFYAKT